MADLDWEKARRRPTLKSDISEPTDGDIWLAEHAIEKQRRRSVESPTEGVITVDSIRFADEDFAHLSVVGHLRCGEQVTLLVPSSDARSLYRALSSATSLPEDDYFDLCRTRNSPQFKGRQLLFQRVVDGFNFQGRKAHALDFT